MELAQASVATPRRDLAGSKVSRIGLDADWIMNRIPEALSVSHLVFAAIIVQFGRAKQVGASIAGFRGKALDGFELPAHVLTRISEPRWHGPPQQSPQARQMIAHDPMVYEYTRNA